MVNALILLNCDEGEFNDHRPRGEDVANILRISMRKVGRVKKRFVEVGLDATLGRQQGQRDYERKADGELEAHLVAMSCGEPPKGFARWTLRLLADRTVELGYIDSISHETVRRVLKKTRSNRGGRLADQCLDRRIGSMDELREEVAAWQARRDQIRAKVNWQFTTENARVKLERLYPIFDV